jgi:hypothetical protein
VDVVLVADGVAGVEAHPDLQRPARLGAVVVSDRPLHRHGTGQRLDGAGEGHHQSVAETLDLGAVGLSDGPT